jgi:hypothetical protein
VQQADQPPQPTAAPPAASNTPNCHSAVLLQQHQKRQTGLQGSHRHLVGLGGPVGCCCWGRRVRGSGSAAGASASSSSSSSSGETCILCDDSVPCSLAGAEEHELEFVQPAHASTVAADKQRAAFCMSANSIFECSHQLTAQNNCSPRNMSNAYLP